MQLIYAHLISPYPPCDSCSYCELSLSLQILFKRGIQWYACVAYIKLESVKSKRHDNVGVTDKERVEGVRDERIERRAGLW